MTATQTFRARKLMLEIQKQLIREGKIDLRWSPKMREAVTRSHMRKVD